MPDPSVPRKSWLDVLSSLTPLILGMLVTGLGAFFTQVYNYRQLQLNQLTALDKFRPLLVSEKADEREFAYASFAALGYEALALKMIDLKRDGAGRAVALEIKSSGDATVKAAATETLAKIPAQVFLHIGDEGQRAKGNALALALQGAGYQPMGIENVSGRAGVPAKSQVRFFNEGDKANAEAVADLIRQQGIPDVAAQQIGGLKARPGTIEVWLSRNLP